MMNGNWNGLIQYYQKRLGDFKGDLYLHNAYNLANVNHDHEVVALTRKKYDFHFMLGRELDVKGIISHFDWLPFYRDIKLREWQEKQVIFWEPYVNLAEKNNLLLIMENVFATRPEIVKPVIDRIGSDRYKFLLDIGHAHIVSEVPLEEWLTAFGKDLVYMHVHNNYRSYDQHGSVLKGSVNFDYVFTLLDKLELDPIMSTEIFNDKIGLLESLDYLENKMKQSRMYVNNS